MNSLLMYANCCYAKGTENVEKKKLGGMVLLAFKSLKKTYVSSNNQSWALPIQ
jgi:hypothetical protein